MPKRALDKSRDRVQRIIHLCRSVERKGVDPFEVDVGEKLDDLRSYLPIWQNLEDLCLDAEALDRISTIVKLQGDWLRYRSSQLYVDPLLLELKLRALDAKALLYIFLAAWHPIVEMEQLSPHRVLEAVEYWNSLPPLAERFRRMPRPPWLRPGSISLDELVERGLLDENPFNEVLQASWEELLRKAGPSGRVGYWDFIYASEYGETVLRAYLASFLVTYGFANLETDPIEGDIYLIPRPNPGLPPQAQRGSSVPIAIDYDTWERARSSKLGMDKAEHGSMG